MSHADSRRTQWLSVGLWLVLVLWHLVFLGRRDLPFVHDEIGYLSHARYLSGTGSLINLAGAPYYRFGYALLLTPAFWLSKNPRTAYLIVTGINTLIASSLYWALIAISRRVFDERLGRAIVQSFVICCLPELVLHSTVAFSENLFVPLYALLVFSFARMLEEPSSTRALAVAVVASFLYIVHPRALFVPGVTLGLFLAFGFWGRMRFASVLAAAAMQIAIIVGAGAIDQHLRGLAWGRDLTAAGASFGGESEIASSLRDPAALTSAAANAIGQSWYLIVASGGLFLLALLAVGRSARDFVREKGKRLEARTIIVVFIGLTSLGMMAASALKLRLGDRVDHFVYGRYNEGFLPVMILVGISELQRQSKRLQTWVVASAAFASIAVFVSWWPRHFFHRAEAPAVGLSILSFVPYCSQLDWPVAVLVASWVASLILALLLRFRNRWFTGVVLASLLFGIALYDQFRYLEIQADNANRLTQIGFDLQTLGQSAVSHDVSVPGGFEYAFVQYLFPQLRDESCDLRRGLMPSTSYFIGSRASREIVPASPVEVVQTSAESALWVMPGAERDRLAESLFSRANLVIPDDALGVTTEDLRVAQLDAVGPIRHFRGAASIALVVSPLHPPARIRIALHAARRTKLTLRANSEVILEDASMEGEVLRDLALPALSNGTSDLNLSISSSEVVGVRGIQLLPSGSPSSSELQACRRVSIAPSSAPHRPFKVRPGWWPLPVEVVLRNEGAESCVIAPPSGTALRASWTRRGTDEVVAKSVIPLWIDMPAGAPMTALLFLPADPKALASGAYDLHLDALGSDGAALGFSIPVEVERPFKPPFFSKVRL